MLSSKKEIEKWLIDKNITDYTINKDLTVDVNTSVDIRFLGIGSIPIQFNKVNGDFWCVFNNLKSLIGAPKEVVGGFDCSWNKLTSLEGCPSIIGGDINFTNNLLTSLKGCPKIVNKSFQCNLNQLTSLEDCPIEVGGNFICSNNKLLSLDFLPNKVRGSFYCDNNFLLEVFTKTKDFNVILEELKIIKIRSEYDKLHMFLNELDEKKVDWSLFKEKITSNLNLDANTIKILEIKEQKEYLDKLLKNKTTTNKF